MATYNSTVAIGIKITLLIKLKSVVHNEINFQRSKIVHLIEKFQ